MIPRQGFEFAPVPDYPAEPADVTDPNIVFNLRVTLAFGPMVSWTNLFAGCSSDFTSAEEDAADIEALREHQKVRPFTDLPPLNGTTSRERIWGWSKPREATNATRKEGTG